LQVIENERVKEKEQRKGCQREKELIKENGRGDVIFYLRI